MVKKNELLRKSVLLGVGMAAYAQEAAEKVARELLKKGHVNKAQGKKFVLSVYQEAQISGNKVAKVMQAELKHLFKIAKK